MRVRSFLVRRVLAVAVALSVTAPSAIAQFQIGNVFASTSNGEVRRYSQSGVLLQTLNTTRGGFTTGSAFDAAGNLYVTDFSANSVSRFNTLGVLQGTFGSGYSTPESIVFDRSGNVYVGNVGGGIRKFNSAGNPLANFNAGRVDFIDLAADQRTMYFTQEEGEVRAYDVVNDVALPNFATGLGGEAFALRILSGGGMLVANGFNIVRLNNVGSIVQTYDVDGVGNWFALNLDPDGESFWSGSFGNGTLYKFGIESGLVSTTINTGLGGDRLYGVSIFGEITQGGPPTTIPEPSTVALLAIGLAAVGVGVRRRRAD